MFMGVVGNIIGLVLMVLVLGNKICVIYFVRSIWFLLRKLMIGIIIIFE